MLVPSQDAALPASLLSIHGYQPLARSSQCGFRNSTSAIFFARDQPFNCFSPSDGFVYVVERRPVQKAFYIVAVSEAFFLMELMFKDSFVQIAGETDVQGSRKAAHNVHAIASPLSRRHSGV